VVKPAALISEKLEKALAQEAPKTFMKRYAGL